MRLYFDILKARHEARRPDSYQTTRENHVSIRQHDRQFNPTRTLVNSSKKGNVLLFLVKST